MGVTQAVERLNGYYRQRLLVEAGRHQARCRGDGWGYGGETAGKVSRIDKVRLALHEILPSVTRFRRVGLITYGPGTWNQCNVSLALEPSTNTADRIMTAVNALRRSCSSYLSWTSAFRGSITS